MRGTKSEEGPSDHGTVGRRTPGVFGRQRIDMPARRATRRLGLDGSLTALRDPDVQTSPMKEEGASRRRRVGIDHDFVFVIGRMYRLPASRAEPSSTLPGPELVGSWLAR